MPPRCNVCNDFCWTGHPCSCMHRVSETARAQHNFVPWRQPPTPANDRWFNVGTNVSDDGEIWKQEPEL